MDVGNPSNMERLLDLERKGHQFLVIYPPAGIRMKNSQCDFGLFPKEK